MCQPISSNDVSRGVICKKAPLSLSLSPHFLGSSTLLSAAGNTSFIFEMVALVKRFFCRIGEVMREMLVFPWWCFLSSEKKLARLSAQFEKQKASISPEDFPNWWAKTWDLLEGELKKTLIERFLQKHSLENTVLFPKRSEMTQAELKIWESSRIEFAASALRDLSKMTFPGNVTCDLQEELPLLMKKASIE